MGTTGGLVHADHADEQEEVLVVGGEVWGEWTEQEVEGTFGANTMFAELGCRPLGLKEIPKQTQIAVVRQAFKTLGTTTIVWPAFVQMPQKWFESPSSG